jgi:hypothetical protein
MSIQASRRLHSYKLSDDASLANRGRIHRLSTRHHALLRYHDRGLHFCRFGR